MVFYHAAVVGSIFAVVFPIFMYYFVFNKHISMDFQLYAGTNDYVTYIILGQSIHIMAFATLMNVGRCLITEIREGTLDTFLLSPASRMGYYIGVFFEQYWRSFIEFVLVVLFGVVCGARIPITKIPIFCLMLILVSFTCFSISILVSSIMVHTRDTFITQNTIISIIGIITGIYFPIEVLPNWIQIFSRLFPLTHVLIMFRNCIQGGQSIVDNLDHLLITLTISILFIGIGYIWFKVMEKKIIEEVYS